MPFEPYDVTLYTVAGDLGTESDAARAEEKIASYLNQQIPIVITAESESEFEAQYEEMCSQVEAMGLPEVIAAYNAKLAEVDALVDQYAEK